VFSFTSCRAGGERESQWNLHGLARSLASKVPSTTEMSLLVLVQLLRQLHVGNVGMRQIHFKRDEQRRKPYAYRKHLVLVW
jgi:hypothetical protein